MTADCESSAAPHGAVDAARVVAVGFTHRTAPLAVRERMALALAGDAAAAAAALTAAAGVDEAFVLATCNRVEVYAAVAADGPPADDGAPPGRRAGDAAARLLAALGERVGLAPDALAAHAALHADDAAALHLCRVAAGLDSMVLGEAQIGAQLRRAVHAARDRGTIGPVLQRLSCLALAAGKRARARLALGGGPASMGEAAVRALGGAPALAGRGVAVLGAGEIAGAVLGALDRARPAALTLVVRAPERAAALAARHGADVAPWSGLDAALAGADAIVACTAAHDPVLDAARLARATAGRRAVTVVDLGVPRNVHPDVAAVEGARLVDVDALRAFSGGARPVDAREAEAEAARWADRFIAWQRARAVVPTIARLRADAERVRDEELDRALARLGDLGPREREVVRALGARLVAKLLHHPLAALAAEPDAPALAASARRLFALDLDAGAGPSTPAATLALPA